jgi:hypothetical protein
VTERRTAAEWRRRSHGSDWPENYGVIPWGWLIDDLAAVEAERETLDEECTKRKLRIYKLEAEVTALREELVDYREYYGGTRKWFKTGAKFDGASIARIEARRGGK